MGRNYRLNERANNQTRKVYRERPIRAMKSPIQKCPKCGNYSMARTMGKIFGKYEVARYVCKKCGFTNNVVGVTIARNPSTGKKSNSVGYADYNMRNLDDFQRAIA